MSNTKLLIVNAIAVLLVVFVYFGLFLYNTEYTKINFPIIYPFVCLIIGGMVGHLYCEEGKKPFLVVLIFFAIILLLNLFRCFSKEFSIFLTFLEWFFSSYFFVYFYLKGKKIF